MMCDEALVMVKNPPGETTRAVPLKAEAEIFADQRLGSNS
jgi:hypothetical protein